MTPCKAYTTNMWYQRLLVFGDKQPISWLLSGFVLSDCGISFYVFLSDEKTSLVKYERGSMLSTWYFVDKYLLSLCRIRIQKTKLNNVLLCYKWGICYRRMDFPTRFYSILWSQSNLKKVGRGLKFREDIGLKITILKEICNIVRLNGTQPT